MGDLFYIIEEGEVDCIQKVQNENDVYEEKSIRHLKRGDHFGELALINKIKRTASVRCISEYAKLLSLDRDAFNRILGQIE